MALTKVKGSVWDAGDNGLGVSLQDYSAVGDGVADDTAAVAAWLNAAMSTGKKAVAGPGTYLMDSFVISTMTGDLDVECEKNAIFKYRTAESEPLFSIGHGTADVYSLRWVGGTIDNSDGTYATGAQSNTGLELERLKRFTIRDVYFKGEATYGAAATVTTGTDSGITTVNCSKGIIEGCTVEGQGDAGIYLSGGALTASSDDSGEIVIRDNFFDQCYQAITTKRQVGRVNVYGNSFQDCRTGFIAVEANSVDPGKVSNVHNNFFKRIETRAVEVRVQDNFKIHDNIIEDFGFQADGTSISGTPYAIILNGPSNTEVYNNKVYQLDWIGNGVTGLHGIYLNALTVTSGTYTPTDNKIYNNSFADVQFGITEATVNANKYVENEFSSTVTTPYNSMASLAVIVDRSTQVTLSNVGNIGTGEDDLQTITVPANTLVSGVNRAIKVRAWGYAANNANAKTLKFYFGTQLIDTVTLTTSQSSTWAFDVVISGSTGQNIYGEFTQYGAALIHQLSRTSATENVTAGIVIKCTGEAVSDDDIVADGMVVEVI